MRINFMLVLLVLFKCIRGTPLPDAAAFDLEARAGASTGAHGEFTNVGGNPNAPDGSRPRKLLANDFAVPVVLRPAYWSQAAYCDSSDVQRMTCGKPCESLKKGVAGQIRTNGVGGDGHDVPRWFVVTDPEMQSVVVGHQGTNPTSLMSLANDLNVHLVPLNPTIFPGAPANIRVHEGFMDTQTLTAKQILPLVKIALNVSHYKRVLVTGHSLGGAIALLDALMIEMSLAPIKEYSDVQISIITYGMPRVGNEAFVEFVEEMLPNMLRITNQKDPIVTLPPRGIGYMHAPREWHIKSVSPSGVPVMYECPGRDNPNCAQGYTVAERATGLSYHRGPYFNNIVMSSTECGKSR